MFAVSASEFTVEGTADVLVNKYTTLWGVRRCNFFPTMGCFSAPNSPRRYTISWTTFGKVIRFIFTPTATEESNPSITQWLKC